MTALSADQPVEQCLARVHRALADEFGHAVSDHVIDGVVHEACGRLVHGPLGHGEEQLLLHTCRISLQARVEASHS